MVPLQDGEFPAFGCWGNVGTLFRFAKMKMLPQWGTGGSLWLSRGFLPWGTVAWFLKKLIKGKYSDCLRSVYSLLLSRGPCGTGSQGIGATLLHSCSCSKQWEIARLSKIAMATRLDVLWQCPVTGMGKFWPMPSQVEFPPSCRGPGEHPSEPLDTGTVDGNWERWLLSDN